MTIQAKSPVRSIDTRAPIERARRRFTQSAAGTLNRREAIGAAAALSVGFLLSRAVGTRGARAQASEPRVFELEIRDRQILGGEEVVRVNEGESVELRFTTDEAMVLHLHGYDVERSLEPGSVTSFHLEAFATGRFPLTTHGAAHGDHDGGEVTLLYLEVYPD
jgi:hypothetical protein